jgi:cell wall-associated NlpC family hydrolase
VTPARLIKAAIFAALAIALGGCASTSLKTNYPANSPAVAAESDSSSASDFAGKPPSQRQRMVNLAMSMLGQPYRYGGAAPGGFDCSGLVAYAANGAGIRLPRTAREQLRIGKPVAAADVRAGDLVFMHLAHKELHVGIAIGSGRFIHAPAKGGSIRIDSLAVPPYARGFLRARRIIDGP